MSAKCQKRTSLTSFDKVAAMNEGVTVFAGITIPSTSTVFLAVVEFHFFVGLGCVIAGVVAMLSKKGRGRHSTFGSIYFWSLLVVFLSASGLAIVRWADDYHLFVLGLLAFGSAYWARTALRRRWRYWVPQHVMGMGGSYILLLTAFYVDNGKNLPLWNQLPQIAFWLLPGAFGLPIIIYALYRHPLVRAFAH